MRTSVHNLEEEPPGFCHEPQTKGLRAGIILQGGIKLAFAGLGLGVSQPFAKGSVGLPVRSLTLLAAVAQLLTASARFHDTLVEITGDAAFGTLLSAA